MPLTKTLPLAVTTPWLMTWLAVLAGGVAATGIPPPPPPPPQAESTNNEARESVANLNTSTSVFITTSFVVDRIEGIQVLSVWVKY
jgi:H+/gluconate symporter-like permease